MTSFEDLSPCDDFGPTQTRLLAVGWLDRERPYAKGDVTRPFFEALGRLLIDPWQPFVMAGKHTCDQDAVEQCPPTRSMPYLRAIRAHGIHRLGNNQPNATTARR